jgi:hypothetical protein
MGRCGYFPIRVYQEYTIRSEWPWEPFVPLAAKPPRARLPRMVREAVGGIPCLGMGPAGAPDRGGDRLFCSRMSSLKPLQSFTLAMDWNRKTGIFFERAFGQHLPSPQKSAMIRDSTGVIDWVANAGDS